MLLKCPLFQRSIWTQMKAFFRLVGIITCGTFLAMDFRPPTREDALRAIGNMEGLPVTMQRALEPGTDFALMPYPTPGDWLAEHFEAGQTFDTYAKAVPSNRGVAQNRICLQPLGQFPDGRSPPLEMLKAWATAFFMRDVSLLPPIAVRGSEVTTRVNPLSGKPQILTHDIVRLLKESLPDNALCALAITMEDLYPHPSWHFVFGQASLQDRVGVFSFARYDPAFYGKTRGKDYQRILLHRSCKVLVHEIAHMFSLEHCIFFECLMNG